MQEQGSKPKPKPKHGGPRPAGPGDARRRWIEPMVAITLRLPVNLAAQLDQAAEAERVSRQSLMVALLTSGLGATVTKRPITEEQE